MIRKLTTGFMQKVRTFAADTCGESIGEVLVAFLIAAMAVAMFAGMIGVATRITNTSDTTIRDIYTATSDVNAEGTGSSGTVTIKLEEYKGVALSAPKAIGTFDIQIMEAQTEEDDEFARFELDEV